MPELPEVETVRRALAPRLTGRRIASVQVFQGALRWPVEMSLPARLAGAAIAGIERRAKYLLVRLAWEGGEQATLTIHLGMSGSLRLSTPDESRILHDHVEWRLDDGQVLRLNDPRRFGSVRLSEPGNTSSNLPQRLGPEPLSDQFDGDYLYRQAQSRRTPIKCFIMDQMIVVGVGNIYASEALFAAGIHPRRHAGRISLARMCALSGAIKLVLTRAIDAGGTTLRNYRLPDGSTGEYQGQTTVYARAGLGCLRCSGTVAQTRQSGRATFYCPGCQR